MPPSVKSLQDPFTPRGNMPYPVHDPADDNFEATTFVDEQIKTKYSAIDKFRQMKDSISRYDSLGKVNNRLSLGKPMQFGGLQGKSRSDYDNKSIQNKRETMAVTEDKQISRPEPLNDQKNYVQNIMSQ